MKRVLILDTSILCVWLEVPNMKQCGADNDRWDKPRIDAKINAELQNQQTTLVLPLASIIETGNHIAKAPHSNYERAGALAELIRKSADAQTPWAAFSEQSTLWSQEQLKALANSWPILAAQKLSLGDVTIKDVAEFYANSGYSVEILTGDNGLKAYEPIVPIEKPRRR
uniref:PIN domain-containing protein n=1 Tax=Chlorobium chlorochromatii (strain CaD3) TaxID=340177 RepID=Q3AR12_CHLCH